MALVEEVSGYLAAQVGLVAGTNLFANILPESTHAALAIFEVPSMPPQQRFGSNPLPAFTRPRLHVVTRSTSSVNNGPPLPTVARGMAFNAYKALNSVTDSTLPTSTTPQRARYMRIEPMSEPSLLELDDKGRFVFGFYCDVMRIPNSSG